MPEHGFVRARRLVGGALLCVLAVAGCARGGGSPTVFAAGFERASTAYEERTEAVKDTGRRAGGRGTTELLAVYDSMLVSVRQAHDDFGDLRPPNSLDPKHRKLLDVLERQEKLLDTAIGSAKAKDTDELGSSLSELAELLVEFAKVHAEIEQLLERGNA
jgi:hypothetical protein